MNINQKGEKNQKNELIETGAHDSNLQNKRTKQLLRNVVLNEKQIGHT